MAVLAKPQALSPAATTSWRAATETIMSHSWAISAQASTPRAKTDPAMSAFSRASSCSSLPPVLSIDNRSAPAWAHSSKLETIWSHLGPSRIRGGRTNSRMSLGVTRRALASPSLAAYLSSTSLSTAVTCAPHSGCKVRSGTSSNSITRPGTSRATARAQAWSAMWAYSESTSAMVVAFMAMGARVKLSSGYTVPAPRVRPRPTLRGWGQRPNTNWSSSVIAKFVYCSMVKLLLVGYNRKNGSG